MKEIVIQAGESVIIRAVSYFPPVEPEEAPELEILVVVGGVNVYESLDGSYVQFMSDLDVCNDGSGPAHGDPYHQAMTAYYSGGRDGGKYLNADKDCYVVVPPQVRSMTSGVVMGCKARVTNMNTGATFDGVVGDIGPETKTGECAYVLAKMLSDKVDYNVGDTRKIFMYELWPGVAATVEGFTYKLQPA